MAVLAVAGFGALGTAALGLGWQAGWLLGGLVGQALFGPRLPDQEGPRLTDLSVTSSAYGAPIPICYGTMRMGGNMIWSTGLIETSSTERVGGKGGARGQKVTSYSYRASFAIAFGEGPADQVLRIWADGKLIFDRTGGIATGQTLQRDGFRMRFYPGDETQLPDPAIIAREGAGNVPAHRGLCYIVFEDFELADFGNRIPQITAEITYRAVASFPVQRLQFTAGPLSSFTRTELAVDWERGRGVLTSVSPDGLRRFNIRTMLNDRNVPWADIIATQDGILSDGFDTLFCGSDGFLYCTLGIGNSRPIGKIDLDAMREVGRFGSNSGGLTNGSARFTFAQRMGMFRVGAEHYLLTANGTDPAHLGLITASSMTYLWHENSIGQSIASVTGGGEREGWVLSGSASLGRLHRIRIDFPSFGGVTRQVVWQFTPQEIDPAATSFAGSFATIGAGDFGGLNFDPSDGGLVFWCGVNGASFSGRQYVVKWRPGLGLMWRTQVAIWPSAFANRGPVSSARLTGTSFGICRDTNTGRFRIIVLDLQSGAITLDSDGWVNGATALGGAQVYDAVTDSLIAYDPRGGFSRLYIGRFGADGTALSGIVADLCARGGLTLADIDISELTASLPGYVVGRQSSIRAALEPLAQAFFFDGVESDERLAFRNRGRAPALTLNPQHLIRLEASSGEAWRERRTQEVELPARVNIVYMDNAADYAQGTQTSKRVERPSATMASRNQLSLELPMALAPGQAKSIAARLLYTAWLERSTYEARLPSDYLRLEPTDVIAITLPSGASFVGRLERVDLGADFSLAIQARAQEAAEYAPALAADGGIGRPAQSVDLDSQTRLFLPDMPLLRDIDDPGASVSRRYIMMAGVGNGPWPGAALYRSPDGETWEFIAASSSAVAWGVLQSVLAPPRAVFATDEESALTLSMVVGSERLESVTQEAMLNGANAALLLRADGTPEIVQFREAESAPDGSFTLRGLLRGRRGTDVFAATSHPVGTRFVLLEPGSIESARLPLGELGVLRRWRAVASGAAFETAPTLEDTASGRDLMPYAPVHLRARAVAAGIEITWIRRTRLNGDLRDGSGLVPLAESGEAYEVDILSGPAGSAGSTVLRTLTTTAPIAIYSTADIAADFGTTPITLSVSLAQISSTIGRGFARAQVLEIL